MPGAIVSTILTNFKKKGLLGLFQRIKLRDLEK